jgi:hypothetical protein
MFTLKKLRIKISLLETLMKCAEYAYATTKNASVETWRLTYILSMVTSTFPITLKW